MEQWDWVQDPDQDLDHEDDGLGFCYRAVPALAPNRDGCGPLDIALDTNILIDLLEHGKEMFDEDGRFGKLHTGTELDSLACIVNIWMNRAIRFHLSPLNVIDAKRSMTQERIEAREGALDQLAAAICCHNGTEVDWSVDEALIDGSPCELDIDVSQIDTRFRNVVQGARTILDGLPEGYDQLLVANALVKRHYIFLTCDRVVIRRSQGLADFGLVVLSPSAVMERFVQYGSDVFSGGSISHDGCRYATYHLFGDSHKWVHLFEALQIE